jgi:hypothetical protein
MDIPNDQPQSVTKDVDMIANLEQSIKSAISTIDLQKSELTKLNEMVTGVLENDATYQEHAKLAKEAAKVKAATRKELLKQTAVAATVSKVKELHMEVKEQQQALSEYLREYQRMSGSNEIEGDDGEVREIVYMAKLIKRSGKFR